MKEPDTIPSSVPKRLASLNVNPSNFRGSHHGNHSSLSIKDEKNDNFHIPLSTYCLVYFTTFLPPIM